MKKLALFFLICTLGLAPLNVLGYALPLSDGSAMLSFACEDNSYPATSYADGLLIENEIEKRTGVKIDWQVAPASEYEGIMQIRLASGSNLPDIVQIPDGKNSLYKFAQDGLIIPLNDLIEQHAPNIQKYFAEHPDIKAMLTAPDGNIYSVGNIAQSVNEVVPETIIVRMDWLEKLGLDIPKTAEDFRQVLHAFVYDDPNGNGLQDEVGLATYRKEYLGMLKTAFGFDNYDDFNLNADGKVQFDPIDPRFKEYLAYMNSLYSEGLITTQIEQTFTELDTLTANQQLGMYLFVVDYVATSDNLASSDPNVNFGMILPPSKPDGSLGTIKKRSPIWGYIGITKDCQDPELAIKWIDYCWASKEGFDLKYYGIQGETYDIDENGNYYFLERITKHPTLTPHQAILEIGGHPSWLLMDTREVFETKYKDTKVLDIALSLADGMMDPMPDLLPTVEENARYQALWPDIQTYVNEMKLKFIMGTESLDHFDKYVDIVKSLGIEEILAIKQAQYDRYLKALEK